MAPRQSSSRRGSPSIWFARRGPRGSDSSACGRSSITCTCALVDALKGDWIDAEDRAAQFGREWEESIHEFLERSWTRSLKLGFLLVGLFFLAAFLIAGAAALVAFALESGTGVVAGLLAFSGAGSTLTLAGGLIEYAGNTFHNLVRSLPQRVEELRRASITGDAPALEANTGPAAFAGCVG